VVKALFFMFWKMCVCVFIQTNSVALSPQANYTDWGTATCGRNLVPFFEDRGMSCGQCRGSPITEICGQTLGKCSKYKNKLKVAVYTHALKPNNWIGQGYTLSIETQKLNVPAHTDMDFPSMWNSWSNFVYIYKVIWIAQQGPKIQHYENIAD
jgi:hypothetical protein